MVQNKGIRIRPAPAGVDANWDELLSEHVIEGSAGKTLLDNGLMYRGKANTGMSASQTTIAIAGLKNLGNDLFNTRYYMQVLKNNNSVGNAPEGEIRQITDYVSDSGTFTTVAFSVNVEAEDQVVIFHETIASLLAGVVAAGELEYAEATLDFNQAASTYDIFTGSVKDVEVESLKLTMPTGNAGGALTAISIQTDDATPQVFIHVAIGVVAVLLSEAQLTFLGLNKVRVGKKIQYTIVGGAHGSAYAPKVTVKYRAVEAGGKLV